MGNGNASPWSRRELFFSPVNERCLPTSPTISRIAVARSQNPFFPPRYTVSQRSMIATRPSPSPTASVCQCSFHPSMLMAASSCICLPQSATSATSSVASPFICLPMPTAIQQSYFGYPTFCVPQQQARLCCPTPVSSASSTPFSFKMPNQQSLILPASPYACMPTAAAQAPAVQAAPVQQSTNACVMMPTAAYQQQQAYPTAYQPASAAAYPSQYAAAAAPAAPSAICCYPVYPNFAKYPTAAAAAAPAPAYYQQAAVAAQPAYLQQQPYNQSMYANLGSYYGSVAAPQYCNAAPAPLPSSQYYAGSNQQPQQQSFYNCYQKPQQTIYASAESSSQKRIHPSNVVNYAVPQTPPPVYQYQNSNNHQHQYQPYQQYSNQNSFLRTSLECSNDQMNFDQTVYRQHQPYQHQHQYLTTPPIVNNHSNHNHTHLFYQQHQPFPTRNIQPAPTPVPQATHSPSPTPPQQQYFVPPPPVMQQQQQQQRQHQHQHQPQPPLPPPPSQENMQQQQQQQKVKEYNIPLKRTNSSSQQQQQQQQAHMHGQPPLTNQLQTGSKPAKLSNNSTKMRSSMIYTQCQATMMPPPEQLSHHQVSHKVNLTAQRMCAGQSCNRSNKKSLFASTFMFAAAASAATTNNRASTQYPTLLRSI